MAHGAIEVLHVSRRFRRRHACAPTTLKGWVARGFRAGAARDFWALSDVTLRVGPGEVLGIVGQNGSGKSTLLRLIGGVGRPDRGSIHRTGRVGSLLDLGIGFHPELTGIENVFVNGVIHGLTRAQIRARLESILEFSGIGSFAAEPLRTYSSGMAMRLAFAVAVHCDPDVLLVDEVLAVGDAAFQGKCTDAIGRMRASGCAIVLVSHEMEQIRRLASTAAWLHAGRVAAIGHPDRVADTYLAASEHIGGAGDDATERTRREPPCILNPGTSETEPEASPPVQITGVRLLDGAERDVDALASGQSCSVRIAYRNHAAIADTIFFVSVSRRDGMKCFQAFSPAAEIPGHDPSISRDVVTLRFDRLDLGPGEYDIDAAIFSADWATAHQYLWHVRSFSVSGFAFAEGVINPPAQWTHQAREIPA